MVIKKTLLKDSVRSFKKNKKRFISIILIIALASSFYVGLNTFKNNMELSAKKHYEESNMFDIKLVSSEGFDFNDKSRIKMIKGVKGVSLYKTLDAKTTIDNKDYNLKLNSIYIDENNKEDYINKISLSKGSFPKTLNEGIVEENFLESNNLNLGDLLIIKLDDESLLRAKKIKIVGTFKNITYSNSIESKNEHFVYLDEDNFNISYYKEGYVTIKGANKYDTFKKEYDNYINKYKVKIDELMNTSTKEKYEYENEDITSGIEDLKLDIETLKQDEALGENVSSDIEILNDNLKKLEKKKENIKKPYYYSVKRSRDKKVKDYKLEIERIKNISRFFPFAFFISSIIITFAEMLRIVNKEKNYVASLKAIGYSNKDIYSRYIIYAIFIGIVGSLIGTIFSKLTINVLFSIYKPIYNFNEFIGKISYKYVLVTLILSIISTCLGALLSFIKDLNKNPASLKRPIVYSKSKITMLENKLRFISKTTIRNILLYKKRFIITIISICLVTSLLLSSFGIKDSFNNSINKQYNKIIKYNVLVSTTDKNIIKNIKEDKNTHDLTLINKEKVIINKDHNKDVYLINIKSKKNINKFINIKKLNNNGVTISKNLSKKLNLSKDDYLNIALDNGKKVKLKIKNITNNYTNNYVYITPSLYKKKINKNITYNTVLVKYNNNYKKQNLLKNNLLKYDEVKEVTLTHSEIKSFKGIKTIISKISNVLVIFSGLLTIIVLYNTASMNITERLKELSIMKSMGFSNEKIVKIIFKEIFILSIIGYITGSIIGNIFTVCSVNIYSTDNFMFSFKIKLISYIFTLIIIFALLFIMIIRTYLNIKKLNVVKNLKNIS